MLSNAGAMRKEVRRSSLDKFSADLDELASAVMPVSRVLLPGHDELMRLVNGVRKRSGRACAEHVLGVFREAVARFVPQLDSLLPLVDIAAGLSAK